MFHIHRASQFRLRAIVTAVAGSMAIFGFFSISHVDAASTIPKNGEHLITIHDRGHERVILTEGATIGEALTGAGIDIGANDNVEPATDETLVASSYTVNIYRARPVVIVDGTTRSRIVTPYQTAAEIAKSAGIKLYDEDRSTVDRSDDLVNDGAGLRLTIERATAFNFVMYGKKTDARTRATTVGEMLDQKGVVLGANDTLSVPASAPITAGMNVELWRNGIQTTTEDQAIDFPIEKITDADRPIGYRDIQTPGTKGKKTVTYEIVMKNGVEESRKEIQSVVIEAPKKQVEVVGGKSNYSESLQSWLLALRTCETGGTYTRNSGNGFYGAYQFMIATWDNAARRAGRAELVGVRPDLASPADQDAMVIFNTNLAKGGLATQHPGCYKKLGLAQFPPGS